MVSNIQEVILMCDSVSPTILLTLSSVSAAVSSMKIKPFRVVTKRNGGGVNGMNITVRSVVEMNLCSGSRQQEWKTLGWGGVGYLFDEEFRLLLSDVFHQGAEGRAISVVPHVLWDRDCYCGVGVESEVGLDDVAEVGDFLLVIYSASIRLVD